MAHEMSIIYPSEIQGAVLTCCWNYGDKATLSSASTATELKDASVGLMTPNESAGLIGSTSDIANQKIYIWGGADDTVTPPSGQEAQDLLYQDYSATTSYTNAAGESHWPSNEIIMDGLKWVYDELGWIQTSDWVAADTDYTSYGSYYQFDQWEFFGVDSENDWCNDYYSESELSDSGYVFVPTTCESTSCKVHFSLNHCGGPGTAQDYDGILQYAATNDIIVVYPEAQCWNSGEDVPATDTETYLTNEGLYPKFMKNLMCRVLNASDNSCETRTYECEEGATAISSIALALIASVWLTQ